MDSYNFFNQYFMHLFNGLVYYVKPIGFLNTNVRDAYKSMAIHKTQFVWFRKLHVILSLYTYINTYTKVEFGDSSSSNNENNNNIDDNVKEEKKTK